MFYEPFVPSTPPHLSNWDSSESRAVPKAGLALHGTGNPPTELNRDEENGRPQRCRTMSPPREGSRIEEEGKLVSKWHSLQ